jgi:hypothetical protein
MNHRDIRAMLRAATAARILDGWQGPYLEGRGFYYIAPSGAAAIESSAEEVIDYCRLLAAAGIEPLYRDSEPSM